MSEIEILQNLNRLYFSDILAYNKNISEDTILLILNSKNGNTEFYWKVAAKYANLSINFIKANITKLKLDFLKENENFSYKEKLMIEEIYKQYQDLI